MLLCAVGTEPEAFDGFVKRFLVVHQVQFAGLTLQFGFIDSTFGLPLVEDGDAQGQPYRVVPVLFHLFAEAEVIAVGIGRTDAGAEAQARNVSGAGNLDVHVGGLYIQFARFDFGTQVEGGLIDVILGRERYQHTAVVEWR